MQGTKPEVPRWIAVLAALVTILGVFGVVNEIYDLWERWTGQETATSTIPPGTESSDGSPLLIFQPCSEVEYQECRCSVSLGLITPDRDRPIDDYWSLDNGRSGTLVLESFDNECAGFLTAGLTEGQASLAAREHAVFHLEYHEEEDPLRYQDQTCLIAIRSNDSRCPELLIDVSINYP